MSRFNKVLHPEIVLGTRVPPGWEHAATTYAFVHAHMGWNPEERYWYKKPVSDIQWSQSQREEMLLTWKFREERPPVYQIGKEFFEAISRIDTKIPIDLLPARFFAHFSYPQGVVDKDGDPVMGVYCYVGPPEESNLLASAFAESPKVFWAVYHTENGACARLSLPLKDPKTIHELAEMVPKDDASNVSDIAVFAAAMNLVLYVNSIEADLKLLRPQRSLKPAEVKQARSSGALLNQCSLPVTFVSWGYQKPRQFRVGSTWVDTFPRWQRHGPQNSQVKLIWVNPFERHFKQGGTGDQ